MKDQRKLAGVVFAGGLDLESAGLAIPPGRLLACRNYEVDAAGGYTSAGGYERFDGRPAPSDADNLLDQSLRRAAIEAVPGIGPVRGVCGFDGALYAWRDVDGGESPDQLVMYVSTADGWEVVDIGAVTLQPGGRVEAQVYTFKATGADRVMVGCDGVNPAFIWDGTTYTQISIVGESEPPKFLAVMKNYLFLAIASGLLYHSVVGEPDNFDPVDGAGVIGIGDEPTGLKVTVNGALAVLMKNRISVLYGDDPDTWALTGLREHEDATGAVPYTAVSYNDVLFVGPEGLTSLAATDAYGNFRSSSMTLGAYPLFQGRTNDVVGVFVVRSKNQIRVVMPPPLDDDGSEILTLTFSGSQPAGWSRQVLRHELCVFGSDEDDNVYAGSTDGFVYHLERGNSFDGNKITAWMRTAFFFDQSPQVNKHFMRTTLSVTVQSETSLRVKPLFDYGSSDNLPHKINEIALLSGGGDWDESEWDRFNWSTPSTNEARIETSANARSMALLIYADNQDAAPHTISDAVITLKRRSLKR